MSRGAPGVAARPPEKKSCLLYTSDAADDLLCVDLVDAVIFEPVAPRDQFSNAGLYQNTFYEKKI